MISDAYPEGGKGGGRLSFAEHARAMLERWHGRCCTSQPCTLARPRMFVDDHFTIIDFCGLAPGARPTVEHGTGVTRPALPMGRAARWVCVDVVAGAGSSVSLVSGICPLLSALPGAYPHGILYEV
jgi:hypothetical protein